MECNKVEAIRSRGIAEQKFLQHDLVGAKKFAQKAQHLFPDLEGLPQLLAVLDVHIVAQDKVDGVDANWYGILQTDAMADDTTIRKQYRKLALILHPDKNKAVGAEGAFKLISEAWGVLSDKEKKAAHDVRRGNLAGFATKRPLGNPNGFCNFTHFSTSSWPRPKPAQKSPSFWTACPSCKNRFQYLRFHENEKVLCTFCQEPFLSTEVQDTSGDASWNPPDQPSLRTGCRAVPQFSEQCNHHHTDGSASGHHGEQFNTGTDDKANSRTEGDTFRHPPEQQTGSGSASGHRSEPPYSSASSGIPRAAAAYSYSNLQFHWGNHRSRTTANHSAAAVRETVLDAYETVKRERVKAQKEARDKVRKERMEAEKEVRRKEHRERREQKQKRREEDLEKQEKVAAHAKKAFDKLFAREHKPSLEGLTAQNKMDSGSTAGFGCRKMDTGEAGNVNMDSKSQADAAKR